MIPSFEVGHAADYYYYFSSYFFHHHHHHLDSYFYFHDADYGGDHCCDENQVTLHVYYHGTAVVDAVEEEDTRTAVVVLNPCIVAALPALDTGEEVH